jgi:hypothetical protein
MSVAPLAMAQFFGEVVASIANKPAYHPKKPSSGYPERMASFFAF